MRPLFRDRRDAGRQLTAHLRRRATYVRPVVLGLPRGGVPVAFEVARALGAPLDVFTIRKLGVPGHEELAMGAVASGGVRVVNHRLVHSLGIAPDAVERVAETELRELERRERLYRQGRDRPDLGGATVLLVDDGVATGASMAAAVAAVREHAPLRVIAAAPVMSEEAWRRLSQTADACEAVRTPEPFRAVGLWYASFPQVSDAEVCALLVEEP